MTVTHFHRRGFLATAGTLLAGATPLVAQTCAPSPSMSVEDTDSSATSKEPTRNAQDDAGVLSDPHRHQSDVMCGFPPPVEKRVTLANWPDSTAHIRWAITHSDLVFKSLAIPVGCEPAWILPRKMVDATKIGAATVRYGFPVPEAPRLSVDDWLRRSETDALVVLHEGHIILEQYFGQVTPHTPHHLMCGGKSVLTTLLAPFLVNGLIDIDVAVTEYVPELVGTGFEHATVRHALDYRTNLTYYPEVESPDDREWQWGSPEHQRAQHVDAQMARAQGFFVPLPGEEKTGQYDQVLRMTKGKGNHGDAFAYVDPNSIVLQWILERRTGKACLEHLKDLWRVLGTEDMATVAIDPAGTPVVSVGLAATARDFARWGQMVLNRGKVGSGHVISGVHELVDHMEQNPRVLGLDQSPTHNLEYNMQFWTGSTLPGRKTILRATGGFYNICMIDLARNTVVVQLASYYDQDPDKLQRKEHGLSSETAMWDFVDEVLPQFTQ